MVAEHVVEFVSLSHRFCRQMDFAAISQIVATTIPGLKAERDRSGGNREKCHVDEKFFRKIPTFAGENWRDWSFHVEAAAKSSSKEAGKTAGLGGGAARRDLGLQCVCWGR